jgi:hypothetical protein
MVTTDLRGITSKSGTTGGDVVLDPDVVSRNRPIQST